MTYVKQTWVNGPAGATPLSAGRLDHIEDGVEAAQLLTERPNPMPGQILDFGKGGRVGTSGKTPIAIRFDDWQDDIISLGIMDLLTARSIPASIALCSRLDTNPWNQVVTYDDIRTWQRQYGMEIWSHGTDHNSPDPDGYAGLVREIVTSKAEIEAESLRCIGWTMPGVTAPGYGSYLLTEADWASDAGRLIQATYGLAETDMTYSWRHVPSGQRYGLGHLTVSDGATLASSLALIDGAVGLGYGLELMCHAGNLGDPGNITLADFTTILDYLVTLRDAGTIEILTPSSLAFADPGSTHRLALVGNGGFEVANPNSSTVTGAWRNMDGTNRFITAVGDSPTGAGDVFQVNTSALISQVADRLIGRSVAGQVLMFEGWCRAVQVAAVTTAAGRLFVQDLDDVSRVNIDRSFAVSTAGWTHVRSLFGLHPETDNIVASIGRGSPTGSGRVQWDDVQLTVA